MPLSGGGGGGGGGGSSQPQHTNLPAAGPPRAISSYPQYNPLAYMGMQPGQMGGMAGMGAPIQSYMSAINGLPGFGGIPAQQLIQALMSGYAGVPMAQQPTGAQAPGMTTQTPVMNTTAPTTSTGGPTRDANGWPVGETAKERKRRMAQESADAFRNAPYETGYGQQG